MALLNVRTATSSAHVGQTHARDIGFSRERLPTGRPGALTQAPRIGAIVNRRAHLNASREIGEVHSIQGWAAPADPTALRAELARFAASGIDVLVIDGGDGTIRDVLSAAASIFGTRMPSIAVVPSGKTNALAVDLGVPSTWTLADAVSAARAGRTRSRSPVEISRWEGREPTLHGFLFGTGAFVRATGMAQTTHRMGAFRGVAVAMALTGALLQTILAGSDNGLRRGEHTRIKLDDGYVLERRLYLALGSTLERLPLGLKPFGAIRSGLKLLTIDASPPFLLAVAPVLLSGSRPEWMRRLGYRHVDADVVSISAPVGFVLDGELFPGGDILVRRGAPLRFVVP